MWRKDDGGRKELVFLAQRGGVVIGGAEARVEVEAEGFDGLADAREAEGIVRFAGHGFVNRQPREAEYAARRARRRREEGCWVSLNFARIS